MDSKKNVTKSQCRKFKIFPFFYSRGIESRQLAAVSICKCCLLKILFPLFKGRHQLNKFADKPARIKLKNLKLQRKLYFILEVKLQQFLD